MSDPIPLPRAPPSDFPSDVLKWTKQNAAPKMAVKLMKCHKYFQHQEFPYEVIKEVNASHQWCKITFDHLNPKNKETNEGKKLWVIETFIVTHYTNIMADLIPRIAVCDVKYFTLANQKLSFSEFKFLTASGNVEELFLRNTAINFENGDPVFIDSIFKCVPNVKNFCYFNCEKPVYASNFIASIKGINFSKIKSIGLDMSAFSCFQFFLEFIEKNPQISYEIYFVDDCLSPKEARKLEKYVQGIIDAGVTDHPPPYIRFSEQTPEQRDDLRLLLRQYSEHKKKNEDVVMENPVQD